MPGIERDLADFLAEAITNDYLLCILVSSYTQAKVKTHNLPFGLGKTTLSMHLCKDINMKSYDWVLDNAMDYNAYQVALKLEPGRERMNATVWDDVQSTAPAVQGVPIAIRKLANFISVDRPELACLIMNAPNMNAISSPLRKLVTFEIIVVQRGLYEVQKISYHKNFKNPLQDIARLDYMEELCKDNPFPPLPKRIEMKYRAWRIKQKLQLYPGLLDELEKYVKFRDWAPKNDDDIAEVLSMSAEIVKSGRDYVIKLPNAVGSQLHRQRVKLTVQA
ncbi:MAG: hypothetical protein E3J73_02780 [Candidatus Bathyarchaeum sp.]|nr:MAG: hypothetical protein E3J73_02780 [Candidatus Bathyarchaeum sp.]